MKKLRVAIIASGFTGQQHLEAVRRIPGTEVVAMADANIAALEGKADLLGVEKIFGDYRKMLQAVHPDVVHNCTPNGMHYEINRYIMEQGIHVYCEKPLAVTLEEGAELAQLAAKVDVACGVNYNYRNNAMVQEMRQRVIGGDVGRLFHVSGQYLQDWMMYDTDYNWRLTQDQGGRSRAVADIGSHWFDTAQWATGKKITAVRATLVTVHPYRKKPLQEVETFATTGNGQTRDEVISSEDTGLIQIRFEDNMMGQLLISQVYGGHKNDLRLEIAGERYAMEWRQENADQLHIGTRENGISLLRADPVLLHGEAARYATLPGGHAVAWADALRNAIAEFYSSIRSESYRQANQTYATFADGFRTMRLVEACLESNLTDGWVTVD